MSSAGRRQRLLRRTAAVLLLTAAAATAVAPAEASAPVGYAAVVLAGPATTDPADRPANAVRAGTAVYWADPFDRTVDRLDPDGTTTRVAGRSGVSGRPTEGPAADSAMVQPTDVAVAGDTVWIADGGGYLYSVEDGLLTVVAGNGNTAPVATADATSSGLGSPYGVAVAGDAVWLAAGAAVLRVQDGHLDVFSSPDLRQAHDVAVGPGGTVLVADYLAGDVVRLDPATGTFTVEPGLGGPGGPAGYPTSVATTTTGDVLATFAGGVGLVRRRDGATEPVETTTDDGTPLPVATVSTGPDGRVTAVSSDGRIADLAEGAAPQCRSTDLPYSPVGRPYSQPLVSAGWPAPVVTLTGGTLPAGLVLRTDGTIEGTPTTVQEVGFTFEASNRYGTVPCSWIFYVDDDSPPPPPPVTPPVPTTPAPTPTQTPTQTPTREPSPTATPTAAPTAEPTAEPTAAPTSTPVADPTTTPAAAPVTVPTTVPPPATAPPRPASTRPAAPRASAAPSPTRTAPVPAAPPHRTPPAQPRRAEPVPPAPVASPVVSPSPTSTGPVAGAAARPPARRPRPESAPGAPLVDVPALARATGRVAVAFVREQRPVSVSLLVVVAGFLLVQDRLDREDPKLAHAPLVPLPDLPYDPPPHHEDTRR